MLTIIDKSLTVYDVTGSLRVPAFAFCLEGKTIAFCTHFDALEALKEGLEQVVQHYQSITNMQPEYALPPVPELPVGLRGAHLIKPDYTSRQHWAADPTKLLQTLQEHGYTAFAALLDHDPELTRVHPYIVRIVVASSE